MEKKENVYYGECKKFIEDFNHETNIVAYVSSLTNVGIPHVIHPGYGKRIESDAWGSENIMMMEVIELSSVGTIHTSQLNMKKESVQKAEGCITNVLHHMGDIELSSFLYTTLGKGGVRLLFKEFTECKWGEKCVLPFAAENGSFRDPIKRNFGCWNYLRSITPS